MLSFRLLPCKNDADRKVNCFRVETPHDSVQFTSIRCRRVSRWLLPCLLVVGRQRAFSQTTPCLPTWTAPVALTDSSGSPIELTEPTVLARDHGLVVVGAALHRFASNPFLRSGPLYVYELDSTGKRVAMSHSPSPGAFIAPLAAMDRDQLNILWGEPDTSGGKTSSAPDNVWATSVVHGTWSTPTKLPYLSGLLWIAGANGLPAILGETMYTPAGGLYQNDMGAVILSHDSAGWKAARVPHRGHYMALSLASEGRTHLLLASSGTDFALRGTQLITVTHSNDAGQTWGAPIAIGPAKARKVPSVLLLPGSQGAVHLVWLEGAGWDTSASVSIGHSVSHDHGNTWSIPDYQPINLAAWLLKATLDSAGVLHAVFWTTPDDSDGTPGLYYLQRSLNTSWTPVQKIREAGIARYPALTLTHDGTLALVFAKYLKTEAGIPIFGSYLLLAPTSCPRK